MKKSKLIVGGAFAGVLTAGAALYKGTSEYTKNMLYRNVIERTDLTGLDIETLQVKNDDGLVLYGYLREHDNAKGTLILLHRLGENAESLAEYVPQFEQLLPETNILLLDAAAHGMSDGYIRGFGYKDTDDLALWIDQVLKKYGEDHKIYIYGQGMGANTALNASGMGKLKNVKFIISDGAYDSVAAYVGAHLFKKFKLDQHVTKFVIKKVLKDEAGFELDDMDTVYFVKNNSIPTIYMHSKGNEDVPFRQVFELYNCNEGKAVLFPIKENRFFDMNQDDDYSKILADFIDENK